MDRTRQTPLTQKSPKRSTDHHVARFRWQTTEKLTSRTFGSRQQRLFVPPVPEDRVNGERTLQTPASVQSANVNKAKEMILVEQNEMTVPSLLNLRMKMVANCHVSPEVCVLSHSTHTPLSMNTMLQKPNQTKQTKKNKTNRKKHVSGRRR